MTEAQRMTLWESLHECFAIAEVAANSLNYHDIRVSSSSYATLLERQAQQLIAAIALVDSLKCVEVDHD